jgi:hypothetical protein
LIVTLPVEVASVKLPPSPSSSSGRPLPFLFTVVTAWPVWVAGAWSTSV